MTAPINQVRAWFEEYLSKPSIQTETVPLGVYEMATEEITRLRMALIQIATMPRNHKLVTSICEIALAPHGVRTP